MRIYTPTPDIRRFAAYVTVQEGGCWNWIGASNEPRGGYGSFFPRSFGYRSTPAHRFMYHITVSPLTKKMDIHHLCENKRCVNPSHLVELSRRVHKKLHARKWQCKHSHPYTVENTYTGPDGTRQCRTCRVIAKEKLKSSKNDTHSTNGDWEAALANG